MIRLIKAIAFHNYRYFSSPDSDAIILRRIPNESTIKFALPFHEDSPNLDLTILEAVQLRNALDELIEPIQRLPMPSWETAIEVNVPAAETFVTTADQSRLSAILDQYPSDSEADRTARKALRKAFEVLELGVGGWER